MTNRKNAMTITPAQYQIALNDLFKKGDILPVTTIEYDEGRCLAKSSTLLYMWDAAGLGYVHDINAAKTISVVINDEDGCPQFTESLLFNRAPELDLHI